MPLVIQAKGLKADTKNLSFFDIIIHILLACVRLKRSFSFKNDFPEVDVNPPHFFLRFLLIFLFTLFYATIINNTLNVHDLIHKNGRGRWGMPDYQVCRNQSYFKFIHGIQP
jgi:hypothetical protein